MAAKEQKEFLIANGEKEPVYSYNQTDFVKDKVAVEVQFGKYAFVAFDLFVKHMLFYSGGVIKLGIEILPTKKMQAQMSSGIAYYEGEAYNVMRQGRNSPAWRGGVCKGLCKCKHIGLLHNSLYMVENQELLKCTFTLLMFHQEPSLRAQWSNLYKILAGYLFGNEIASQAYNDVHCTWLKIRN